MFKSFNLYEFSLFLKINFLFTLILSLGFLFLNNQYTIYTFFLTLFGLISTVWLFYLLYYIISFPFRLFFKSLMYFSAVFFVFINVSLVLDFFIYKIYHFHINAMVLNIIFSPEAFDSIQFGKWTVLLFFLIISLIVYIEYRLIKYIFSHTSEDKKRVNRKLNIYLTIPAFFIVIFEKIVYGYHDMMSDTNVLTKFKVIPVYTPLLYSRFAEKHFGLKPKYKTENTINVSAKLKYPLKDIDIADIKKYNIFIFAIDAVRNSDVNIKTAPNIVKLSTKAYRFNNHFSGGNATRFGIFSLFYGLNSTYWFNFLSQMKGPVLFNLLKKSDYNFFIGSSTSTKWPEFYKTVYVDIQDSIYDKFSGSPWQKDQNVASTFINYIQDYKSDKPIFSFVFLDAPHGYSFPKSENIFKAEDEVNYLTISKNSKNVQSAHAGYKNAIHYDDKLISKMIQVLKEKGLYENSLIILTSDHGQEFYEYGYFGHNSAFSKAQTNSFLIIKPPKNLNVTLPKNYPNILTSHVDIVPTILNILNISTKSNIYSNGLNIFDKSFKREFVFCANWYHNAIITKKYSYIFSNLPNQIFNNEVRDKNYHMVTGVKIPTRFLSEVIEENSRFLK